MHISGVVAGVALIGLILGDGFETVLQPRRVTRRYRLARLYYQSIWMLWRGVALRIASSKRREAFLSIFGPLSLLTLFMIWVTGLVLGFALVQWSLALPMRAPDASPTLFTCFYMSGTTFFTLGFGDITPITTLGRMLSVVEAGLGFGFLAAMITYLPVLYQAFSQRELTISLLDARAGSPPSASEFLLRMARSGKLEGVDPFLTEWERWAADLLESHLSFPVLSFYRSQHDNQSWLAALTVILDTSALLLAEVKGINPYQSQLTFAMARHAAVDLDLVLSAPLHPIEPDRLPPVDRHRLRQSLQEAGVALHTEAEGEAKLAELRGMYEPFIGALGQRLLFSLPPVVPKQVVADNWQRSAWMQRVPGIGRLPVSRSDSDHFG